MRSEGLHGGRRLRASLVASIALATCLLVSCADEKITSPEPLPSTGVIEPGGRYTFLWSMQCGAQLLGPINGTTWIADEARGSQLWSPPEWSQLMVDGRDVVEVEVQLTEDGSTLLATAAERDVRYRPAKPDEALHECS